MIPREAAIQQLKDHWGTNEFIFQAEFHIPAKVQLREGTKPFGYFRNFSFNGRPIEINLENVDVKDRRISIYQVLNNNLDDKQVYQVEVELARDEFRNKNPYALVVKWFKKSDSTERDVLAYVNFVADDCSHAFVKVVDGLNIKSIKSANGVKGERMYEFPQNLRKEQIIVVKKRESKQVVSFVSDVFKGRLCNGNTFIDLDTFPGSLGLSVSSSIGFTIDELESYNSRINCAVNIFDSSPGFAVERVNSEENLVLSDLDVFVNKNIQDLLNSDITEYDFNNRTKFLEKVDAGFRNKITEVFQQNWENIVSNSEEDIIREFLIKWTKKYPDIVLFSNLKSIEFISLFMKMWQENQLPINFFEEQLLNVFINHITSQKIRVQEFLIGLHPNGFALIKTKYLEVLDTPFSIETIEVYSLLESLLHDFPLTEDQKENAFKIIQSSITDDVLSELDEILNKNIQEIVNSEITDYDLYNRTKFLEKVDPGFRKKITEIFQQDWENQANNSEENVICEFLVKWTKKYPEIVLFSNLLSTDNNRLFVNLWQENQLPINFFEDQLFNVLIKHLTSVQISYEAFLRGLQPNSFALLKIKFLETLDTPISIESMEEYSIMESLLQDFSLTDNQKENALHIIQSSITDEVQFELWKENKVDIFPIEIAHSNFNELDAQQQEHVMFQLEDEELIPLLDQIKPTESSQVNERLENLNQRIILEKFGFLVFDIESNTKTIVELAWSNGNYIENFIKQEVESGITKFKVASKNKVLIGHNILDFDLPILSKISDFHYDVNFVWDTLSVEKVLSPELKTYALNTKHTAKEDVSHTLELFKNQFLRVLKLPEDKTQLLKGVLSMEVLFRLKTLSKEYQCNLSLSLLNQTKSAFFRPQPKTNSLIETLKNQLSLSNIKEKVILADESLVADLMNYGQVTFSEKFDDKLDFQLLNIQKVQDSSNLNDAQKGQLSSYYLFCQEQGLIPFWGNVSPSIRNEIEGGMDVWTLFDDIVKRQYLSFFPRFIFASELSTLTGNMSENQLFVIQPDLISISQKQLLKQVEVEQLKALFQDNFFWMKFSGGQSVVNISKKEVQKLIIENIDDFDSFWIEKYQFGKYRIYANKNWEQIVSKIPFKQITRIDLDPELFKSDQVVSVKFKSNKSGEYNVTRFNPESIYRSRYWVIQKKIIDQLVFKDDSILLIQRREEIDVLTKYFESDGYYIPNCEIGLGRRLELLHRNSSRKKLIIAHLSEVDSILKCNHSLPVNLIVDSFNLIDTYYCAKGTSIFNDYIKEGTFQKEDDLNVISEDEDNENMDVTTSKNADNFLKDYVFLLKLLRPKITSLRNLLFLNNPDNRMLLLDPRIDDYSELSKQWNITKQHVQGWNKKEDFEKEVLKSEGFIKSPKPLEIPFSEEETIEIIRNVFIGEHQWKPEQLPYLKEILKTKEDWLVNLPTGVGKSVLFQGPALLKSAFTNRLTIVITPLKALMEDHVNKLWELGFYGCVDYLNADRSSDTELIYRSIAGGEMSLLFVTPERFRSKGFLNAIDSRIQSDGGLEYFVFDEAHCVSQWGHDFRPDYFNCAKQVWRTKTVSNYPTPLLLFSATVSEKIYQDFNTIFS